MSLNSELVRRAEEYAKSHELILRKQLGSGVHGIVLDAESLPQLGDTGELFSRAADTAIKVHRAEPDYRRERDIYLRLKQLGLLVIRGCHVPELVRYDDDLWIIEMTVVTRPFVLDFAGAFLDRAPDFSDEVLADWRAEKLEQFGSRWSKVEAILRFLEGHGIFMIDVSPNNISLPEK